MIRKHILLLLVELVLGFALAVLGSMAVAQGSPDSRGDLDFRTTSAASHMERKEFVEPSVGRVASHVMSTEPVQLQIAGGTAVEGRVPLTVPLHDEARAAEHYYAARRVRPEFKVLVRRVVDEAYSIPLSVSTRDLAGAVMRRAVECVVISPADSGPGTLRQCLENAVTGVTITFDAGIFPPTSPVTISLSSALPWIITDSLTIDASNAGVILSGGGLSTGTGLVVVGADGVKIRGLRIVHFPLDGVAIAGGATNTTIGGDRLTGDGPLGQGNLISGNGRMGIWFQETGTMSNTVLGNYVGTDISGTAPLANVQFGIFIGFGANNNTIGGDTPGVRNLISGNADTGVWIQDPGTSGNRVYGNHIGTDISGTTAIPNYDGVFIGWEATGNTVGGDTAGSGNLISGNDHIGVKIHGERTADNQVVGNYIGTDVYGMAALPNYVGVLILSRATDNTVGGEDSGARNLISGNTLAGVWVQGGETSANRVLGNYIGTDVFGTAPLGNEELGVFVGGATNNIIGGDTSGARNLISGNGLAGIWIEDPGTSGNRVLGNYIGTDISGVASLGNAEMGVFIQAGATDNVIGGDTSGARNLISGNGQAGVQIEDVGTSGNQVLGNYIGTDISGVASLGNAEMGVFIQAGATDNIIGGDTSGARNLISGNGHVGVWIEDDGTSGNQLLGNYIGTDVSGIAPLGNIGEGILIHNRATNNTVGGDTPGARNLISGNGQAGVQIEDVGTSGNQVLGNYIGTDVSGTASLANEKVGVFIVFGAANNIIGGDTPEACNLISGNGGDGVAIQNGETSENQIRGNYIGLDVSGASPLGNGLAGVFIGFGATHNTVGISNTIVYNAAGGVVVSGTTTLYNTVTRNVIHDNGGSPIDLVDLPIPLSPSPPMFICFSSPDNVVEGTTCPGCRVEIFANPTSAPAGTVFLGAVSSGERGGFSLALADSPSDQYLAATATYPNGTTSKFSEGFSWLNNLCSRVYLPLVAQN